ncbi:hypothetical protein, partial [Flexithrix dorotheae]|uniref:hypothetical protein n=1 Tax=Flexithrix dorotheae TaxID=70993 RepID=UPI000477FA0F
MKYLLQKKILQIFGVLFFLFLGLSVFAKVNPAQKIEQVFISLGDKSGTIETKVANLLKARILEKSAISVIIGNEALPEKNEGLVILLGRQDHHTVIQQQFKSHRIPELSDLAPGQEGFLLKELNHDLILVAGYDDRGCLYAVGELLRQIIFKEDHIQISQGLDIRTAPAFEIRGTQFGQSGVAKRLSKVREWTKEETERVILDYALAGANIFSVKPGPMYDFIKSYGLMTQGGFGANTAPKINNNSWKASESIGRTGYICPSVGDARAYMLKKFEDFAKESPDFDLLKFHGGDGGGCECDQCNPYGLTFIKLVEDMANIFHHYHPRTKIYFTNQKFDNEDDQAIFNYLQEKPRDWLWGWGFGPGSDATTWQPGHRQTHRMDLFRYPGFGPYSLYPLEIVRQMPPVHKLVYYNEITHWKYAQHAYIQMYPRADKNGDLPPHWGHDIYERRPDQFLTMVYNRLTFYAWPRNYHRIFNDLMRYGVGDITHSSGHHDHFNQWMWQRLLWSPRTGVEEVVEEYCRTWFGESAAPEMAKAIFQLEENMEELPGKPLSEKEGILEYYSSVQTAGEKMDDVMRKNNWLWLMYMQKGVLDRYVQLAVIEQMNVQEKVEALVAQSINQKNSSEKLNKALELLEAGIQETEEMISLKIEAG